LYVASLQWVWLHGEVHTYTTVWVLEIRVIEQGDKEWEVISHFEKLWEH